MNPFWRIFFKWVGSTTNLTIAQFYQYPSLTHDDLTPNSRPFVISGFPTCSHLLPKGKKNISLEGSWRWMDIARLRRSWSSWEENSCWRRVPKTIHQTGWPHCFSCCFFFWWFFVEISLNKNNCAIFLGLVIFSDLSKNDLNMKLERVISHGIMVKGWKVWEQLCWFSVGCPLKPLISVFFLLVCWFCAVSCDFHWNQVYSSNFDLLGCGSSLSLSRFPKFSYEKRMSCLSLSAMWLFEQMTYDLRFVMQILQILFEELHGKTGNFLTT